MNTDELLQQLLDEQKKTNATLGELTTTVATLATLLIGKRVESFSDEALYRRLEHFRFSMAEYQREPQARLDQIAWGFDPLADVHNRLTMARLKSFLGEAEGDLYKEDLLTFANLRDCLMRDSNDRNIGRVMERVVETPIRKALRDNKLDSSVLSESDRDALDEFLARGRKVFKKCKLPRSLLFEIFPYFSLGRENESLGDKSDLVPPF